MSIRREKSKTGKVSWLVDIWENGRGSKRIRKYFDKKVDAEKWEMDFLDKYAHSATSTTTLNQYQSQSQNYLKESTFEDECNFWIESNKTIFSHGHIKRIRGIMVELGPRIGKYPLSYFTVDFLTKFQTDLKSKKIRLKNGKSKIPKNETVNRKTEVIMAVLNFAVKMRRISSNPAKGFSKFPKDSKETAFWEKKEVISFLNFTNKKYPPESEYRWVYVVYLLALNTGLRAGEIWGLQPRDIPNDGE
ncbi:MAG: hypothetical protein HQK49_22795 [Oligoflexia bacterium]|nr:hypothetical protein [Oligoflexia bacterium]